MKHHCPECRTPVLSLMMIDSKKGPEFYCERCCSAVTPEKNAPTARELVRA